MPSRIRMKSLSASLALAIVLALVSNCVSRPHAGEAVATDADDIGGVVMGEKGPEAGVWVIAETTDLPTKLARIVVTDAQGRYLVPDLPEARYDVFVRGYGLIDSPRYTTRPGQHLDMSAKTARDARERAQVYPAAWWLSMLNLPPGPRTPQQLGSAVNGCLSCHQLGNGATRVVVPDIIKGTSSLLDAWDHRVKVGPRGPSMESGYQRLGPQREMFAKWTARIENGEAPRQAPDRPTGVERNVVVSLWDWGTEYDGRTDNTASDVRDARVNANGLVYGVVQPTDILTVLDPVKHHARTIKIPSKASRFSQMGKNSPPSPYWGHKDIWERVSDPRSLAMDTKSRLWFTGRFRDPQDQPAFCVDKSNPFSRYYALAPGDRQVSLYDPGSGTFSTVDTCFRADHNQIGKDDVIYFGMDDAVAWINMKTWDETHNAEASQGWCPAVLDTNGDGRITTGWTEPNDKIDSRRDHRVDFGCYSPAVSPADGSVWCVGIGENKIVRVELGPKPPESCRGEVFEAPPTVSNPPIYGSGGIHIATDGVVWQDWRGSGHFTAFDRRKCKTTTGPTATGQSCPEGWSIYRMNKKPTYENASPFPINSDESYLTQVDHHDVLGFGQDTPLYGAVNTDSLEVFLRATGEFLTLRVPYPLGFFSRSSVGRIDDPKAGWKGKGLWSSYSNYAAWHLEGGPGTRQKAVKFQIRPDPLAK